ncbi:MAG TPA: DNA repair protein RecN [Flavobacterium sp.]|jgi:DNA repair protein RecN (Recombination protein N)|nr:DNA repair protein RecN [Flavobacterium sp.]HPJ10849.1 DNA repair protein RecN [Flavobacterium sp.]
MITSLSINNFALIEKLAIDFSGGFSIITGETGAGKSILLGALGLVLGKRADLTSLKNKEEKCVVEAQFDIADYNLRPFFESNDLDYEDHTIIRREILPSGKSRAFINDTPVNLQELQDLSTFLIDVHSQHQTQELSEIQYQFQIIDAIAANKELLQEYGDQLRRNKENKSLLQTLTEQLHASIREQDYNSFLLEELQTASLKAGEQQELESVREQLANVEHIRENLDKSVAIANNEQYGLILNLNELKLALQKTASFSEQYQSLYARVDSMGIELKDVIAELERLIENLFADPEQLETANQKLQTIYNLQKKHQVTTVEELLVIQSDLELKVTSVASLESEIAAVESTIAQNEKILDAVADSIRQNRIQTLPVLTQKWSSILSDLGMPNVRFKIEITPTKNYTPNGKDELQFLFSANKGSDFGLLKKVASGGEMSRIMLATKAILAEYSHLPTIIFDEIDTGVSGEIANKMGEIMRNMSTNMQVFAITHLPQIAAKGATHFKVYKSILDDATHTELKILSNDERVLEIAQMLSGTTVSDSALNHAKALLN